MTTTTQNGTDMTTPHVTEISSPRQSQIRLADVECGAHERELRHSYDALTPVDMGAYRSRCAAIREGDGRVAYNTLYTTTDYRRRCAEIRALDARADAARSEY